MNSCFPTRAGKNVRKEIKIKNAEVYAMLRNREGNKLPKVLFEPMRVDGKFEENITLLEAADELDIGIRSPCKGRGVCRKCKVRIKVGLETSMT